MEFPSITHEDPSEPVTAIRTVWDGDVQVGEPEEVIPDSLHIEEAKPFKLFLREHTKEIAAGAGAAALVLVVGVGSLVVSSRHKKK